MAPKKVFLENTIQGTQVVHCGFGGNFFDIYPFKPKGSWFINLTNHEFSEQKNTTIFIEWAKKNEWFRPLGLLDVKETLVGKAILNDFMSLGMIKLKAYILDTETHDKDNPIPTEIAYVPVGFDENGGLFSENDKGYSQRFNPEQPITIGASAVTGIFDEDVADMPSYKDFVLPNDCEYIIGHNIDFDCTAIENTGNSMTAVKRICTLALARALYPSLGNYTLGALMCFLERDIARKQLKNAHSAKYDVWFTFLILRKICADFKIHSLEQLYELSQTSRIPKIISFGKHKGTAIDELPRDYINYMLKQDNLDVYLKQAFEAAIKPKPAGSVQTHQVIASV